MIILLLTIWISGLLANPFPDENKIENLEENMIKSLEEKRIADDNDEDEGEEPDDDDKETIMDDSLGGNMTLDRDSNCHPTTNNWKCCSTSSKCDEGEGDCDKDSHCAGTL